MYDELKEEEIVNLVGGRFKLSTLIQKRLVQLNQGANPLIDTTLNDKMEIVLQEIRAGKIRLDMSDNVQIVDEVPDFGAAPELDLENL
ncbi:MAG: DNA-directed RNA polymerase subunit omega [Pirellulaceae bacterium]|nr:DNA-directed RNA polymerase subunit omega [Pirellulaceae bacterium]